MIFLYLYFKLAATVLEDWECYDFWEQALCHVALILVWFLAVGEVALEALLFSYYVR